MTAFFRKRKVKLWRLLIAALIGTTYLLILFVEILAPLYSWYGKLILSILIILAAYGIKRISLFLKDLLVFYVVSFIFGGGMLAIQFIFQSRATMLNGFLIEEDGYLFPQSSLMTLLFGYLLMFYLSKIYFNVIEVGKRRDAYILPYRIEILGCQISGHGLMDSGNQLHEPITGVPVIVIQLEKLKRILPIQLTEFLYNGDQEILDLVQYDDIPVKWQSRIRVIPYHGIGKGNQMMIALTPDWVEIIDGNHIYRVERVRIGIKKEGLSAEGNFDMILHPALLNEDHKLTHTEEGHYANSISP